MEYSPYICTIIILLAYMKRFFALPALLSALFGMAANSPQVDYPGGVPRMGAVENADGSVTFCLAAPKKASVTIVPAWDSYQVLDKNLMNYQDYQGQRYFWITVSGLDKNTPYPYYYYIDNRYKVADPYATLVADCYNDKSIPQDVFPGLSDITKDAPETMMAIYCGHMWDYEFSDFKIPDHDHLVIYEMLLRDFTGTDGMAHGTGTVAAAIEKIPYLKELGVNAVELMPIMEFSGNNSWGYNTNFYMAPDKAYGTPLQYKEFVETCHRNGIAVILDIVLNHSDGLHPWYQMYSNNNPFYNASAPHEYSVFNDWRQEHPLVRRQWVDAITWWMTEYNVDGFRFDLSKGLGDSDSYAADREGSKYNASRIANLHALNAAIKAVKPNGIHINEHFCALEEEKELYDTDGQLCWGNAGYPALQYAAGQAAGISQFTRFYSANDGHPWGSTVAYAESHDEERMGYYQTTNGASVAVKSDLTVRTARLGAVAAQMLMSPGPKMIWQFGELGADQTTKNASGNDTGTKKVVWGYLDDPDRKHLHDVYQALIRLRMQYPALFGRDAKFVSSGLANLLSTPRTYRLDCGTAEAILFINPAITGASKSVECRSAERITPANSRLVCASQGFVPELRSTSGTAVAVNLPANGFALYVTGDNAGIDDITADSSDFTVIGGMGEIIIRGSYTRAQVYSISGISYGNRLQVPTGMYIVVVDGHACKVAVK